MLTIAAAANSGIFSPSQPVCSWGGYTSPTSTFTITNVLPASTATYAFVPTTGTISFNQSTGILTVSTSNEFEVTITPTSIKGQIVGSPRIVGRKNITTYTVTSQGGCISGGEVENCGPGNCPNGSCDGPICCGQYATVTNTYENSPPANYQKIGSVWVRL